MSSFTDFTHLVKQLDNKEKILKSHVDYVNDIAGKNETDQIQLVSYHYHYFIYFFISILLLLFIFRTMNSDTSKIDAIILLMIIVLFLHHLFASYF